MAYQRRRQLGLALIVIGIIVFGAQINGRLWDSPRRGWDEQARHWAPEEFGDFADFAKSEARSIVIKPDLPEIPEIAIPMAPDLPEIPEIAAPMAPDAPFGRDFQGRFMIGDDGDQHGGVLRFLILPMLLLGGLMVLMGTRRRREPTIYHF